MSSDPITQTAVDPPMISPDIVVLIPYGLARQLHCLAIGANGSEITVMMPDPENVDALTEIQAVTGRAVTALAANAADVDRLLEHFAGRVDSDELWLQHRHIAALNRLVDHSLNLGQLEEMRTLVERALEFAPYSDELWLMKARMASRRGDVVEALTVASEISPHDGRVRRWLDSLREAAETEDQEDGSPPEAAAQEESVARGADISAVEDDMDLPSNGHTPRPSTPLAEEAFKAARAISEFTELDDVMRHTAQATQALSGADSVSVYFHKRRGWTGFSTEPELESRMSQALPKANRVAAQAMKQQIPVIVNDTAARASDIGPLIAQATIKSFALLPVRTGDDIGGLVYLNFREAGRADRIFEPDLGRSIEVVLNCAGAVAGPILQGQGRPETVPLDDYTDTYTLPQFQRMLVAEVERARRYRFSVSVVLLQAEPGSEDEAEDGLPAESIQTLARAIRLAARSSDVIGHAPPGEFVVMLPQTTAKGANLVARRMEKVIGDALWVPATGGQIEVTAGIATFPDDATEASALLESARADLPAASTPATGRARSLLRIVGG